jgi:hypothetical protein
MAEFKQARWKKKSSIGFDRGLRAWQDHIRAASARLRLYDGIIWDRPHPNLLPLGEGTDAARLWFCEVTSGQCSRWMFRKTADDSPSPGLSRFVVAPLAKWTGNFCRGGVLKNDSEPP